MRRRTALVAVGLAVAVATGAAAALLSRGDGDEAAALVDGIPPETFVEVASGVALLEQLDCRGRPVRISGHAVSGTGFLVGSRVVMTAEHGIWAAPGERACGFRARLGGRWYDVVDVSVWQDRGKPDRRGIDLATMKLSREAPGHVFELARESVPVGSPIAALGHPLGLPLSFSQGIVVRKLVDLGQPTIAARIVLEGGSSGGPIVDESGRVVSVVQRLVLGANLTPSGTSLRGGIDLARWWGDAARADLCRAYPDGGIPDCDETPSGRATKVAVRIRRG